MSNGLKLAHFLKILKFRSLYRNLRLYHLMEVNGALLTALSNLVTLEGEDIFQTTTY
jgi:hypothetical protein